MVAVFATTSDDIVVANTATTAPALFPIPYTLYPISYSLFPIPYSLLAYLPIYLFTYSLVPRLFWRLSQLVVF